MGDLKEGLADALDGARRRSLGLLDPLSDDELLAQHSPLMSPLVWDLAHVGHYEELWLLRAVARTQPIDPAHDDIYDAFRHARKERAKLAILGPAEARRHIAMVRGRVLDVLDRVELDPVRPAAHRRLRLRDGGPARASARRDDAGHAAADGAPSRIPTAPPPTPGRPAAAPAPRCWSRAGRS